MIMGQKSYAAERFLNSRGPGRLSKIPPEDLEPSRPRVFWILEFSGIRILVEFSTPLLPSKFGFFFKNIKVMKIKPSHVKYK